LGRFVSADTIVPTVGAMTVSAIDKLSAEMFSEGGKTPGSVDPQMLNRYAYSLNNPVNFTDPSGHDATLNYDEASEFLRTLQHLINDIEAGNYDAAIEYLETILGVVGVLAGLTATIAWMAGIGISVVGGSYILDEISGSQMKDLLHALKWVETEMNHFFRHAERDDVISFGNEHYDIKRRIPGMLPASEHWYALHIEYDVQRKTDGKHMSVTTRYWFRDKALAEGFMMGALGQSQEYTGTCTRTYAYQCKPYTPGVIVDDTGE
jgi:hypothetical protein